MTYHQEHLMGDLDKLHPWSIVRILPDMHSRVIIRFRRRNDAEAHLQILRSKNPTASYEIVFDIISKHSDSITKLELSSSYLEKD